MHKMKCFSHKNYLFKNSHISSKNRHMDLIDTLSEYLKNICLIKIMFIIILREYKTFSKLVSGK